MNSAVIGVGSNINPEENVLKAEKEVALLGSFFRKSSFIYTKPLGYKKQDDFLNGVFHIDTPCVYDELNDRLKEIENRLGRVRTENKFGPRTIDLDTVIYNYQVKDADVLTRDFIRNPVIELIPELEETLISTNYKSHFRTVNRIIEKILSLMATSPLSVHDSGQQGRSLPETNPQDRSSPETNPAGKSALPLSVYGSGQWFGDGEKTAGDIDFLVITENAGNENEKGINRKLNGAGLGMIGSSPVNVRLFTPQELKNLSRVKTGDAEIPEQPGSFARELPLSVLLYRSPGAL